MRLSEHFTLEEMIKSQTGTRKGIDNTPGPEVVANLVDLCVNVLEKVREKWGSPVTVNSGYRCPKLNRAIGGAKNSQHLTGQAADIEVPGIDNLVIFEWIRYNLEYDQLILEYYKAGIPDSGWVHVSWKSSGNRKNIMVIK